MVNRPGKRCFAESNKKVLSASKFMVLNLFTVWGSSPGFASFGLYVGMVV